MRNKYPQEFKDEAVRQVIEKGYGVCDVAKRLGITDKSLYNWVAKAKKSPAKNDELDEIKRLKAELKRVTEERDILKEGRSVLCKRVKERYAFIKSRLNKWKVTRMCSVLNVHRSGFYAWLNEPESPRAIENQQLLREIKEAFIESGGVYGSPRITSQLKRNGTHVGENRVARLMRVAKLKANLGYKRRYFKSTSPSTISSNHVQQQFVVAEPDNTWVTDITYIKTYEGWLYLAVVVDLFSRKAIGWSMQPTMKREIVIKAILMAVWRRQPKSNVIVHSDQGSQYTSDDYQAFLKTNNLTSSMSRRGHCLDNAVAESFFHSLKTERVKRKIYATRNEAKADLFDYIEVFYNRVRLHSHLGHQSPEEYEIRYKSAN
ncbi:IS3 family transposase [Pseudoalteromonas sp. T1lg23B]|uniref:IS3 family transposase n=1 Tax=Pseudoalteromonas sp. T1lg23B TaxID=2077097 RepID=UPI000CF71343